MQVPIDGNGNGIYNLFYLHVTCPMIDCFNLINYSCTFDYLEIYYVNNNGFKDLIDRFCGTNTPKDFISHHPKMEILFVSDFTKHSNGFLAHYTFLGDSK